MSTYCVIGKLKIVPIEGAKTLSLGYYGGLPYAVSKDVVEDKLYAIFIPDGRLSREYYEANKEQLTFFGKNLKVRSIKLMSGKITSVGFVADISTLAYTGYDLSKLEEGMSFNELNGVPVCSKFVNIHNRKNQSINTLSKKAKLSLIGLPEHPDTEQFYKFASTLEVGDLITISTKMEGTSCRIANAYEPVELNWYQKLLSKFVPVKQIDNRLYVGTRRVIIQQTTGSGWYGSHDMYLEVGKKLEGLLYPGEAIYGEIVGWQDENRPLFTRGGMKFLYGTLPGQRDFYVYNIKWTLPNGQSIDLPWNKIKSRCLELGLKHVPEIRINDLQDYNEREDITEVNPNLYAFFNNDSNDEYWMIMFPVGTFVYDGNIKGLELLVYSLVDGPDPIDPSHIREGVVLRVEKANGETKFFKAKSSSYYQLESKSKEAGEVDIEEEMSEEVI